MHPCFQSLARDLRSTDYGRVHFYSRRIRRLGRYSSVFFYINPLVISVLLAQQSTYGLLLPNLLHVDLNAFDFVGQATYARLVGVPSLRTMSISIELADPEAETPNDNLDAALLSVAHRLTGFTFNAFDSQSGLIGHCGSSPPLMKLHSNFHDIQTLNTRAFNTTHPVMSHLSQLPNLKTLHISITADELALFNSTDTHHENFPSLVELEIETSRLTGCAELLKSSGGGFGHLESLTINECGNEGSWDLGSFFQAAHQYLSHSKLKVLRVAKCHSLWDPPTDDEPKIDIATLAPMFSFPNLVVFQITIDVTNNLDNTALLKIATAWPKLRVFRLFEQTMDAIPRITLSGFLHFVASCTKLEDITLRLDARNPPTFAEHGPIVPCPQVHRFNVCTSPIGNEDFEVASILNFAFPSLQVLIIGWYYMATWGQVFLIDLSRTEEQHAKNWQSCRDILSPLISSRSLAPASSDLDQRTSSLSKSNQARLISSTSPSVP
ncbi:hypothetical protein Hypma_001763 [Hypsizygus marmoreus]|uniref:F-box domain-containing protein n=1 Tax=Hypsizygus marmoreus TaxID=39966 RepID=A0A369JEF5_HYPMA|nr:hypothetical protein Hypma_001763 [Hypsizygus marmoreus]